MPFTSHQYVITAVSAIIHDTNIFYQPEIRRKRTCSSATIKGAFWNLVGCLFYVSRLHLKSNVSYCCSVSAAERVTSFGVEIQPESLTKKSRVLLRLTTGTDHPQPWIGDQQRQEMSHFLHQFTHKWPIKKVINTGKLLHRAPFN